MKGLEAKPCVDILLGTDTRRPRKLIETFTRDGWMPMSRKQEEQGDILCFSKGCTALEFTEKVCHLHIRYPAARRELYLCEYLRTHDVVCRKCAALKRELVRTCRKDRDGYTQTKTGCIEEIIKLARVGLSDKFIIKRGNRRERSF